MSGINEYFLTAYNPPELSISTHNVTDIGIVDKYLKSRQTIHLSKVDLDKLVKDESSWFYKSDIEIYDKLGSMSLMFEDGEFDDIKDGHGISEYIGVYEKYLPSIEYLQYVIMNNSDVVMTIYDAYSLYNITKRNEVLRDKVIGQTLLRPDDSYDQTLPEYEFIVHNIVPYTKFINVKYEPEVFVPCFQDPIPMISVNIPYSFYMHQPLPHDIYNWDIDTKEHKFGSLNDIEFEKLLTEICTNGITKPLFMRMHGEVLSAVDEETNLILFIAKILKLPSIPVNIYLSNEDVGKNHLMDAVINSTENNQEIYKNIGFMKSVFEPYMIIHKENDTIISNNIDKYRVFSTDNNLVIRYLISTASTASTLSIDQNIDVNPIEDIHKEMHDKEIQKINSDITDIIKNLLGQE